MKSSMVILLMCSAAALIAAEEPSTKDLDIEDNEDLERGHRKRKKHQQNQGPCGYGKTFGEKFLGLHDYTYVSAPVMNYFFGCGVAALPVAAPIAPVAPIAPIAPIAPFPIQISQSQSQSHGHHGHGQHHGGHGGHGGGHGGFGGYNSGYNPGFNQYPQPVYNQGPYQRPYSPGPFQSAVSAAASGFGSAFADYITRPRKTQKIINRQVNQFLKPLYKFIGSEGYGVFQSKENILPPKTQLELENGKASPEYQVTHPTSYMDTMLHIFRGNIGSGLLAMGDAFKNGGIIFATGMTALLGIICVHAQHLLLNCSEEMHRQLKREKPPGFAETVYLVFLHGPIRLRSIAPSMKLLVNAFLCTTQLGFCCVYIVFIANNVKMICDFYGVEVDLSIHMIIVVIPVLLACMVRNLKYLTPFSTIANIMMAIGVSVVVYEASRDLPSISDRDYIANWQQLPLYFGTAVYAFEGIGLVLPLKSEMRRPEQFQKPLGVLNVGMVFVGSIFIVVGFLGYLKWGDSVMGSLTLNLQPGLTTSNVVQSLIALAIMFTYPLQLYVPVDITWPALRKRFATTSPVAKELGYRAMLVLLTFILAESIPHLGLFISLVGAVSSTALALIFPPMIELVVASQKPEGASYFMIIKDCIIMLLGVFIFITGTYESVASIIRAFQG